MAFNMKNIFCDDGSTNVKLAWFEDKKLETSISVNSFRTGWKVEGMGRNRTFNYQINGTKYTYDEVSHEAMNTTNIEYQYGDINLLAVHHALLNSGLECQPINLTVTLPISEFYTPECQKNEVNIQRKIDNLMRPVILNKNDTFTIVSVEVMPESLPAVFTQLVADNVGKFEKSLVVDLGGTTLDLGVIVGQFDDVSAIHGNPSIGVSMVTKAALSTLKMASSDTSSMIADELIKQRNNPDFVRQLVNDESKTDYVLETIEHAIRQLGDSVINEIHKFRNVNRVYLVGGGAPLIEKIVKSSWSHLGDKIIMMDLPQTALVRSIATFKEGE